jgi:hypothetical protein
MTRPIALLAVLGAAPRPVTALTWTSPGTSGRVLAEVRFACHGPDKKNRKADLRLDTGRC